ncbi:MAG: 3'-5' exonuclease [Betaproteobacteria bacterium]
MAHLTSPSKEQMSALEPLGRLELCDIVLVSTRHQAEQACLELQQQRVLGFDTESKPTFVRDEVSQGPHVVQFSTLQRAYVFQLHDALCRQVVCVLLESEAITKVGFGLAGDQQQILRTLGVTPRNLLDLNLIFRGRGYIKELGVRAAVALVFNRRFVKSRKATTSNWANRQLSQSQIVYAGNDAWAAIKVHHALELA